MGWSGRAGWTGLVALAAWCALPVWGGQARLDQRELYQGFVGKAAVVMELEPLVNGRVQGRYFYRRYRADLGLSGQVEPQGDVIRLTEDRDSDKPAVLVLRRTDKGLVGRWWAVKGAQVDGAEVEGNLRGPEVLEGSGDVPVRLVGGRRQVPSRGPEAAGGPLQESDPYELQRLAGLRLQPGKVQRWGSRTLRWWQEPVSKVQFFRLEQGYSAASRQAVNRALAALQWTGVRDYFGCLGNADTNASGRDFDRWAIPMLVTDKLVSLSVMTDYYCGGAHPDRGDDPVTLEVATGRRLQLQDLLWLGEGKPPAPNSEARGDYLDTVQAPWLLAQFQRLHPEQFQPGADEDCNYGNPGIWASVSWYLTPQGLVVSPFFPHVAQVCAWPQWAVLPYGLVRQYGGARVDLLPRALTRSP